MKKWKAFLLITAVFSAIYIYRQDPNLSIKRFLFNREKAQGNIELSAEKLKEKIDHGIPLWMKERVQKDLMPFKERGIYRKNLFAFYLQDKDLGLAYFKIEKGTIFAKTHHRGIRFDAIKESLEHLNHMISLPDCEFLFTLEDVLPLTHQQKEGLSIPIFAFAKGKQDRSVILYPHFSFFAKMAASYAWTTHIFPRIEKVLIKWKWEKKKQVVFWRGATTGIDFSNDNWENYPRMHLCALSKKYPEIIDAKFTYIGQASSDRKREIKKKFPCTKFVSPEEHLPYKYLITLDGNTCTSPGLYWRLLSNSVTFKQETDQIEHFYDALIPYEHYIPIKEDLSDLIEQIKWAKDHDERARDIAKKSTQFVYDHLLLGETYLYIYHLLTEYHRLLKDHVDIELPHADCI